MLPLLQSSYVPPTSLKISSHMEVWHLFRVVVFGRHNAECLATQTPRKKEQMTTKFMQDERITIKGKSVPLCTAGLLSIYRR